MPAPAGVDIHREMERPCRYGRVYAPAGAYSDEDKRAMSEAITSVYAQVPIPKFYVVTVFEEIPDGDLFIGGVKNARFVRFRVDHIARDSAGSDPSRVVGSYGGHDPQALGRGPLDSIVRSRSRDALRSVIAAGRDPAALRVHRREAVGRREPGKQLHRRREASRRAAVRTWSDGPSVLSGFRNPTRPALGPELDAPIH